MAIKTRSDSVGQIDGILSIAVQLGIPTGPSDPTPQPTDADGGDTKALLFYNTTTGSLRAWLSGVGAWADAVPLTNYYNKSDIDSELMMKVDVADANTANGWLQLNSSGIVDPSYLPSYTDTIQEVATYSALPTTGADATVYIALDTSAQYRWGGTVYVELVASPGTTDSVPEGSTNLYFLASRVLATVLAGFTLGSPAAIAATDTLLAAMQKLQAQINAVPAIPAGGTTGQFLKKNSGTNYDTSWAANSFSVLSGNATDNASLLAALNAKTSLVKFVTSASPTGAINGTNTVFTLPDTINAGTETLYKNGVFMKRGTDYTITGSSITMTSAPVSSPTPDVLSANYIKV